MNTVVRLYFRYRDRGYQPAESWRRAMANVRRYDHVHHHQV